MLPSWLPMETHLPLDSGVVSLWLLCPLSHSPWCGFIKCHWSLTSCCLTSASTPVSLQPLGDHLFALGILQQCSPCQSFLCWFPFPSQVLHSLSTSPAHIRRRRKTLTQACSCYSLPSSSKHPKVPLSSMSVQLWEHNLFHFFPLAHLGLRCQAVASGNILPATFLFSADCFCVCWFCNGLKLSEITFLPLLLHLYAKRSLPLFAAVLRNASFMHLENISSDLKNQVM